MNSEEKSESNSNQSLSKENKVKKALTPKERVTRFYEKNPGKLKEKIICPDCGFSYFYTAKHTHLKLKKHINAVLEQKYYGSQKIFGHQKKIENI